MTKRQRIEQYNKENQGYDITGIKKLNKEHIDYARVHYAKSLDELYKSYSYVKRSSYRRILDAYKPVEIIGLQGGSMTYSVYLKAENGDILWITRDNNYLVEVV